MPQTRLPHCLEVKTTEKRQKNRPRTRLERIPAANTKGTTKMTTKTKSMARQAKYNDKLKDGSKEIEQSCELNIHVLRHSKLSRPIKCALFTWVLGERLWISSILSSMFCAIAWFCGRLFPSIMIMYSVAAVSSATWHHRSTMEIPTDGVARVTR